MEARQFVKKMISIMLAIAASLMICKEALANVPIGAAILLAYPTLSYFVSPAIALIVAVTLESVIFSQITKYNLLKTIVLVFAANVLSSVIGLVIAMSYSSPEVFFFSSFLISWLLSRMFKLSCSKASMLPRLAKSSFGIFELLLIACYFLGTPLLAFTDTHWRKTSSAPELYVTILCTVCLVMIGLLFTVVMEAYMIIKYRTHKNITVDKTTVKSVVIMNLFSYAVLSALYGPTVIKNLLFR